MVHTCNFMRDDGWQMRVTYIMLRTGTLWLLASTLCPTYSYLQWLARVLLPGSWLTSIANFSIKPSMVNVLFSSAIYTILRYSWTWHKPRLHCEWRAQHTIWPHLTCDIINWMELIRKLPTKTVPDGIRCKLHLLIVCLHQSLKLHIGVVIHTRCW